MLWRGAWASESTTPSIYFEGKSCNVRSVIWRQAGHLIRTGHAIKPTCGEPDCVALEHLESVRYRAIPRTAAQIAAVTRAMRARSVIDMQVAEQIRASSETGAKWARRTGLSEAAISEIRLYKRWVPVSMPFSGLLR